MTIAALPPAARPAPIPPDRVPPNDAEAEIAVLGAMLLDADVAARLAERLRPESFYSTVRGETFRACVDLLAAGTPVDLVTVGAELDKRQVFTVRGAARALIREIQSVPSTANADHYAGVVLEHARRRELLAVAREIERDAHDLATPPESTADYGRTRLLDVATPTSRAPAAEDLAQVLDEGDDAPPEDLVERLIVRPGVVIVFGASGSGKSYALQASLLDLVGGGGCFAGVEGLQLRPRRDAFGNPDRVLWVYGSEDPRRRVKSRARLLWETGPHAGKPIPHGSFRIVSPRGLCLGSAPGLAWVEREIVAAAASVVVLDTVQSLTSATLEPAKSEQVAPWMTALHRLRDQHDVVVIVVAHTTKTPADARSARTKADALLGSQAWRALADGVVMFDAPDGDASRATLRLLKGKDIEEPIPPVRIAMDPRTRRFHPVDDDAGEPTETRTSARVGRPAAVELDAVLALRERHPDGLPWSRVHEEIGVGRSTWFRVRSNIQARLLELGHVVVEGALRWGR